MFEGFELATIDVGEAAIRVRLPGERGLALRRRALAEGLRLYPGIMDVLRSWADRLGVRPPEAQAGRG